MPEPTSLELAEVRHRLRTLRKAQGLTQEDVAERAALSKNFVSALERGTKGMSLESFLRYVDALGLTPAHVFGPEPAGVAEIPAPDARVVRFGQRLRGLRDALSHTQATVAEAVGYSRSAIANLETGRMDPTLSQALALADFFRVPLAHLLAEDETPTAVARRLTVLEHAVEGLRTRVAHLEDADEP